MSPVRTIDDSTARLVEAALAEAVADARWRRLDLESRRPLQDRRDLMLAQAAELALSPIGRDQLMSLALEWGAEDDEEDRRLIDVRSSSERRTPMADRILALTPPAGPETEALVSSLEARHARRLRPEIRFDLLSDCLEHDAILNEALWDHPDIPAGDDVRRAMLRAVSRLRERARDLSVSAPAWWRPARRWITTLSSRGAR